MDNANSIAMIIYKAFMVMYLLYYLHLVITKHLSKTIITSITQEKLNGKELANVSEHIISRLRENNNTDCTGIANAPIPMSEKYRMTNSLCTLTLYVFRKTFINKQSLTMAINIAVITENVMSIVRSMS